VNDLGNADINVLTAALLENSWSIIIGLVCVVVLCVLAWFFSPKGENQTYVHPSGSLLAVTAFPLPAVRCLRSLHATKERDVNDRAY
jgi:V-type H+-transporting ATPase subunit e